MNQIRHNGYFNEETAKTIFKAFFKKHDILDVMELRTDNPTNENGAITVNVNDGTFELQFRSTDINVLNKSEIDASELLDNLNLLGSDGLLVDEIFKLLKVAAPDYGYIQIKKQDEKEIIIAFEKSATRGFIHVLKKVNSIVLTYQPTDINAVETLEELNIKSQLEIAQKAFNSKI